MFDIKRLTKDLYLYIAGLADERTMLRMLSVSKQYHSSKCFRIVLHKQYPLLGQFNINNEPWMQFYYRKLHYISRLMRYDGIVYLKTDNYDPQHKYNYGGGCPRGEPGPIGPTGPDYPLHMYTHTLIPYSMSNNQMKKKNYMPRHQKQPKINNRCNSIRRANRCR